MQLSAKAIHCLFLNLTIVSEKTQHHSMRSMATNSMYPVRESNALSFQQNAQSFQDGWRGLLDKHLEALQTASSEGSQASTGRHQTRGQLLGRFTIHCSAFSWG